MRLVSVLTAATLMTAAGTCTLEAQACTPPAGSGEAKLLAFYEAPIAFSPFTRPLALKPGAVVIGGEITAVPNPSAEIEQTGYCFKKKTEHTRLSPVFPRPRIAVGLPAGFMIEASYLPPVTLDNAQPSLGSLALSWGDGRSSMGGQLRWMLRAHGTYGRVRGPITCPERSLQQISDTLPCFGTHESRDTFHPNMFGGEGVLGWSTASGRVGVYAGTGVTREMPRFEVGFTDANGVVDNTHVQVDLTRVSVFGGVGARAFRALELSLQVYSIPTDVTTARLGASWQLW